MNEGMVSPIREIPYLRVSSVTGEDQPEEQCQRRNSD